VPPVPAGDRAGQGDDGARAAGREIDTAGDGFFVAFDSARSAVAAAGMAFYRLTRLARVGEPGQVLVSQTTAALLEGDRSAPALHDLGERKIPDFDEPTRVYELPSRRSSIVDGVHERPV
jgi:class 3 adenylate cyclase